MRNYLGRFPRPRETNKKHGLLVFVARALWAPGDPGRAHRALRGHSQFLRGPSGGSRDPPRTKKPMSQKESIEKSSYHTNLARAKYSRFRPMSVPVFCRPSASKTQAPCTRANSAPFNGPSGAADPQTPHLIPGDSRRPDSRAGGLPPPKTPRGGVVGRQPPTRGWGTTRRSHGQVKCST
jgi:hypothetical protein